jgi:two-component system, OmpR family, KDP operon response regulator KdpE
MMTSFMRKNALVVEDEPLVAGTIVDALSDEYSVSAAATVADAVRQLRQTELAVVLLDCLLPDGNAAEVIAAPEAREVAIVLMSGNPDQIATYSAGGLPFLSKPFGIEELRKALRAVLPEARPAPAAGRVFRRAVIGQQELMALELRHRQNASCDTLRRSRQRDFAN